MSLSSRTAPSVSKLQTERLSPSLGAIVRGLHVNPQLDEETVAAIQAALDEHLVLFFEDQHLGPVEQRDFAARLGELYLHPFYPGHEDAREVMILENDENRRANADRWHADVTYLEKPPRTAVLYSVEIPEVGGDTLWANMYLAYEALSAPVKTMLDGLRATHSFAKNFTPERFKALGWEDRRDKMYAAHPPVSHPVARTNPANGRKALFVNQDFTSHVERVSPRESDVILRLLYEQIAQPEFQIRWRWQPNTLVLWDNRWTQHCALADYFPNRRLVRRVSIVGDRPV